MPVVRCPTCRTCLRFQRRTLVNSLITLSCPACKSRLKVRSGSFSDPLVLVAHADQLIAQQLMTRLDIIDLTVHRCTTGAEVATRLAETSGCLLLLDVAFGETFPFELINQAKERYADKRHKVVLLPAVYNRAAYKKKPTSLYGADAYLELHHIGDRLLPLIAGLYPALRFVVEEVAATVTSGSERDIAANNFTEQANRLAKLLVADIAFYHQQELQAGLQSGQAAVLLAGPLAEGRKLLRQRLPAAGSFKVDFVGKAFWELCQQYSGTQAHTTD